MYSSAHSPCKTALRSLHRLVRQYSASTMLLACPVLSKYPPVLESLSNSNQMMYTQYDSTTLQLFASISAHRALTFSRFCFASSLFLAVRSRRSARRHILTSCLRFVHIPIVFHMKPLAWHSSRAVMISSQPGESRIVKPWSFFYLQAIAGGLTDVILGVEVRMHVGEIVTTRDDQIRSEGNYLRCVMP